MLFIGRILLTANFVVGLAIYYFFGKYLENKKRLEKSIHDHILEKDFVKAQIKVFFVLCVFPGNSEQYRTCLTAVVCKRRESKLHLHRDRGSNCSRFV